MFQHISGKSRYISSTGESKGIFSSLKSEQVINEGVWNVKIKQYLSDFQINIKTNIYCRSRREN